MSDIQWNKHLIFGSTLSFSVPESHDDTASEILSSYWMVRSADMQKTDAGEDFLWLSFENTVFSLAKKYGIGEDAIHVLCRTRPEFQMRIDGHACSKCSQPFKWVTRSGAIATLKTLLKEGSAAREPCARAERVAVRKAKVKAYRGKKIKEGLEAAKSCPNLLNPGEVYRIRKGMVSSVKSKAQNSLGICRNCGENFKPGQNRLEFPMTDDFGTKVWRIHLRRCRRWEGGAKEFFLNETYPCGSGVRVGECEADV